jgi:alanine-synthesizing transaminase
VHYPCRPENGFEPDPQDIEALITPRTRAIVVINPNNPTGAVYSRRTLEAIARLAEKHHLIVFCDEIYDQILYDNAEFVPMAPLVHGTLCATMSGLSKVYRACGYRVGWVSFSGEVEAAREYLQALDKLSSLRLCSNVPGQWAVQTALGGYQSIRELTGPGGRLYQSRQAIIDGVARSKYLQVHAPQGAIYAFIGIKDGAIDGFDDQRFAMDLLEHKHVLLAPGTSFNAAYKTHFRITNLPRAEVLVDVFRRMEELLDSYANGEQPESRAAPNLKVVQK